ncbi:MAG: arsenate reductase ArsC [Akkermansiaceae bacterium]|nr:arsenate reductase ArsC [Akkermansiaceae bacterium]
MAAALVNRLCSEFFTAESAGITPGEIHPLAVQVMNEIGIDIASNKTQAVFDVFKTGKVFVKAISLCPETVEERCPIVVRSFERLHWPFDDPAALSGTDEERVRGFRTVRDSIRSKIEEWCMATCRST